MAEVESVIEAAKAFTDLIANKQWGFAIDATVTLDEDYYGHKNNDAVAWIVTEEGIGNVKIYPFRSKTLCLNVAKSLLCCWVAYDKDAEELGSGGYGFAHQTCRVNGARWIAKNMN